MPGINTMSIVGEIYALSIPGQIGQALERRIVDSLVARHFERGEVISLVSQAISDGIVRREGVRFVVGEC